ncbi:MAG: hypothetical protein ABFR47_08950 [Verrucomicrobiota bacterium]
MRSDFIEEEIIVHPVHGMQLSEGFIRKDNSNGFLGSLPGLLPSRGKTKEEVRAHLEEEAKTYYGEDVVVEIVPRALAV